MAIRESGGRKTFELINVIFLICFSIVTLYPFISVFAGSFASATEIARRPFMLFPNEPSIFAYRYIFSTKTFIRSMINSIYRTVLGTLINLIMTFIFAYPLAHRRLVGRKVLMNLVVFTMMFGGGMIPGFLNIKQLGLIDTIWALLLPGSISTWNLIVIKNFIQNLPEDLEESARLDGAGELYILWRIVIPLSLPILATFSLMYAVGHWNAWFDALLYINDSTKWPVQILLRQIITQSMSGLGDPELRGGSDVVIPTEAIKNACILVTTVPILLVYPFLQKYFTKGALLGSIKG